MDNAIAALGAVTGLIVALTALFIRAEKIVKLLKSQSKQINSTHGMVNSQRTELIKRIDELTKALTAAGITIPVANTTVQDLTEG